MTDEEQKPWYTRAKEQAAKKLEQAKAKVEEKVDVDRVLSSTKMLLEVGSDAADVMVQLGGGITPMGAAALTLRAVNSVRKIRSRTPNQYFAQGYKPLQTHGMLSTLYEAFIAESGVVLTPVPGMHDSHPAYTAVYAGVEFGWAVSGHPSRRGRARRGSYMDEGETSVQGVWIREDVDELQALEVLGRCVWKYRETFRLLARNDKHDGLTVIPEPPTDILPSATGKELYDSKIKPKLEKGYNRSIFLIGEPGVGKSVMLRYIAQLHGGLQLRFKLADMRHLDGSQISQTVQILRPNTLLIDDFDRFVGGGRGRYDPLPVADDTGRGMFDPLQEINEMVPLFMVSANYSSGITEALLRPGRFDEIILIEGLEPELYEKLLPGAPKNIIREIQRTKMPVSHVVELAKRAHALDWDWKAAVHELNDLANRSNRVLKLNEARKKPRKKSTKLQLAGKSQRQKAALLETRAGTLDRSADRLLHNAEKNRTEAEKMRKQSAEWRKKAETAEKKAKETKKTKRKTSKKKTSKKKTSKKPKTEDASTTPNLISPFSKQGRTTLQRHRKKVRKARLRRRKKVGRRSSGS